MLYLTLHVDHKWKYKKKRNIKYNIYPSISLYPLSKITRPIIYYIKYQDETAYIYNQTYNLIGNGIIDLNSNFHLGIARFISLLRSDIKIGFVSQFSDQFYNIQLDISKSGIMERGFNQVNTILAS